MANQGAVLLATGFASTDYFPNPADGGCASVCSSRRRRTLRRANTRTAKLEEALSGVLLEIHVFAFTTHIKCLGVLGICFLRRYAESLVGTERAGW